jgi:uncharacterized RDD family membrane protein YckC
VTRAGFGERLIATIIDGILLAIVKSIFFGGLHRATGVSAPGFHLAFGYNLFGAESILDFAYFAYFEGGLAGQTIGKKIMNIRVVRVADGGALGWGTALLRNLCRYVSAIPCFLGFFWMLWDKDKMTWHDKLSSTLVIPTSVLAPPPDSFGRPPST